MNSSISHELEELIQKGRAAEVGLAAYRQATGEQILLGADKAFHPASVIKLCVMMETFRQARIGTFSLEDMIPVHNRFRSIVDGSDYSLDATDDSEKELYDCIGESFSRHELVRRMIRVSSNLATNMLMEELQPAEGTEFMRQLGAGDLILRRGVEDNKAYRAGMNNSGTARGFMKILMTLAERKVVSPEDSDEMIQILFEQQFNEMIPAQLPSDARVAHKTGWTADYFHDAGIVYPPDAKPIVLAILTKGYPESEAEAAHAFVAELAKAVYEAWT